MRLWLLLGLHSSDPSEGTSHASHNASHSSIGHGFPSVPVKSFAQNWGLHVALWSHCWAWRYWHISEPPTSHYWCCRHKLDISLLRILALLLLVIEPWWLEFFIFLYYLIKLQFQLFISHLLTCKPRMLQGFFCSWSYIWILCQ